MTSDPRCRRGVSGAASQSAARGGGGGERRDEEDAALDHGFFKRVARTMQRAAQRSQVVTRRRHSRHGLGFASLGAVVGGDVAVVVVLVLALVVVLR